MVSAKAVKVISITYQGNVLHYLYLSNLNCKIELSILVALIVKSIDGDSVEPSEKGDVLEEVGVGVHHIIHPSRPIQLRQQNKVNNIVYYILE